MILDDDAFQALLDRVGALERKLALIDEHLTPKALAVINESALINDEDATIDRRRHEHERLARNGFNRRIVKLTSPAQETMRPAERLPSMLSERTRTEQADTLATQRRHDREGAAPDKAT